MNHLLILIAPPASGKTYWISQFQKLSSEKILFLSPLRALADECKLRWAESIDVRTPEEWMMKPIRRDIVIIDEYHLYFYWGDTFRPLMWEVFYELISEASLVIFLTATLSEEMKKETLKFSSHFHESYLCDFGNQTLKFQPQTYFLAPSIRWLEEIILLGPRGGGVNLIFCQYREEVRRWTEKLQKHHYSTWGFVGGEAGEVSLKMKDEELPHFIVATTVLSHGVNLPEITCIYFTYKLNNVDFWIQMVARGGRKGESYEVFSLERPVRLSWSLWRNYFNIFLLTLKLKWKSNLNEFWTWYLKE
jgi:superfamily II DNA helicase RecQ